MLLGGSISTKGVVVGAFFCEELCTFAKKKCDKGKLLRKFHSRYCKGSVYIHLDRGGYYASSIRLEFVYYSWNFCED